VTTGAKPQPEIAEKDLHHWQMLQVFQEAVEQVCSPAKLPATFSHPGRELGPGPYLSLFLFGLYNPVVDSMRGLCAITALPRVQEVVACKKVSLGSFSEVQHLLDASLLREVLGQLSRRLPAKPQADTRLAHLNIILQDGSLWSALPRMTWAEYGVGRNGDAKGVRLHLRFNLLADQPADARVQPGASCERAALREMGVPGQINVGDRYYGEDYKLFRIIHQNKGFFVFRIKEGAVITTDQELPLSPADLAAGVVRHAWVRLGATPALLSMPVRLVEIKTADQHLLIVTNLPLAEATAELVGLIYKRRWTIELFFRWVKCILGCRHFFAESPNGVAIQLYLALIASVLFQFYTGRRPNKRVWEFIQMYFMGWATGDDLTTLLGKDAQRAKSKKNQ
jgi:hypothetical protein